MDVLGVTLLGTEIPLWVLFLILIIVVIVVWKLIKFALKILIILVVFFIILFGLDALGVFDSLQNIFAGII